MESKLQFIRAWQALPEFGLTLFLVKHQKQKKEELLGENYESRKVTPQGEYPPPMRGNLT